MDQAMRERAERAYRDAELCLIRASVARRKGDHQTFEQLSREGRELLRKAEELYWQWRKEE